MDIVLPVPRSSFERAVLLDPGALIAIASLKDQHHESAAQCLANLEKFSLPLYITTLTIAETQRRLLYDLSRRSALRFLESVYIDSIANIIRPLEEDERQAMEYTKRFADQDLTFTDTVNMAVMKRIGLRKVFSFDWHFSLLGFQVIPPLV